ncbi:unnamed protein product [Chrysoparadoxa australica]
MKSADREVLDMLCGWFFPIRLLAILTGKPIRKIRPMAKTAWRVKASLKNAGLTKRNDGMYTEEEAKEALQKELIKAVGLKGSCTISDCLLCRPANLKPVHQSVCKARV